MQNEFIVVGIILLLFLWGYFEQKQIRTTKYTIVSTRLKKQWNDTGFVVLADLHNCIFGKKNERLIKRIDKLSPEFIIIAGDMINKKEICYPSNAFTLIESLSKKYTIYYAYGNHEQRMEQLYQIPIDNNGSDRSDVYTTWVEFLEHLNKLKVILLNNESITITKNNIKIRITGISIGPQYFVRHQVREMEEEYVTGLVGISSKEDYQILIAHNPTYFNNYVNWGADLTIAGHLHGGMIRIPGVGGVLSPQAKFFPKYHSGNHTEKGQEMVVSRGLGSHSVMPRLFNIPELLYIKLKNES